MLQTNSTRAVPALYIEQKTKKKWTATSEDHLIDPTRCKQEQTRHWVGVHKKTPKNKRRLFNSCFLVCLHQIEARRASTGPPAETGCGGRGPAFRQTSLQAPRQERGDVVGSLLGPRGGGYPRTPALFLLQVTPAIAGGPSCLVPEGSPHSGWTSIRGKAEIKRWILHQPALRSTEEINWFPSKMWAAWILHWFKSIYSFIGGN